MKYARLQDMKEYIAKKDFVSLDELCEVFNKSKSTVRRDMGELLEMGSIEKVYGGVRMINQTSNRLRSYNERDIAFTNEKAYMGKLAAEFVRDNDVIFIDSGTTTVHMIPHLKDRTGVTVLTNNLKAISICMDYPNLTTICFGGQLHTKTACLSSGFCDLENLSRFNINKAFMGTTGVSIDQGATNTTSGELIIKTSIVEISKTPILVADSSKFNRVALLTYAKLDKFNYVITDKDPGEKFKEYFDSHGVILVTE